jgi:hypothetical protein
VKSLLHLSIILSFVIGVSTTSCQQAPAKYAPQQLSAKEVNDINFNTLFGEGPSSIAGDYTFTISAKSLPMEDIIGTTSIEMSMVVPVAVGQDGFELTVRSSDLAIEGLPMPFEIPTFKAQITASDSSGMYMRGSGDDFDDQRAFVNAEVYEQMKVILLPVMQMYSDPEALAATFANADVFSPEYFGNLFSQAVYEKLTLNLDHIVGNRFFYTSDFANQLYPMLKQVLSQVEDDDFLEYASQTDQQLGTFLKIFLSLSDEQLEPIMPALANCFNIDIVYELALNNYNELIFVSYAIDFSLPPHDAFVDNLNHLINLIPAEFGLQLPNAQQLLALAASDAESLDTLLNMSGSMFVGFKNLDLNDLAPGHFDFEQPESAIDYSDLVGPELPMFEQLLNDQLQNSASITEDAAESEVF